MLIYYAHSIDQRHITATAVTDIIKRRGAGVYDPGKAWDLSPATQPTPALQRGNLAILRHCDGVVVHLQADVLSIGAVLEIVEAKNHDIPVIVYGDLRPSWALAYLDTESTNDPMRLGAWIEGLH
jgi:hypothetical protein